MKETNRMFARGDRVRMVFMPEDPDPIMPGTEGTVEMCSKVFLPSSVGLPYYWQVVVRWDNGRKLQAVCPPDKLELVEGLPLDDEKEEGK